VESRFAQWTACESFRLGHEDGAEPGRRNVACDLPGASERVEFVSHFERTFALIEVVEGAPVGVQELQGVLEHRLLIGCCEAAPRLGRRERPSLAAGKPEGAPLGVPADCPLLAWVDDLAAEYLDAGERLTDVSDSEVR